MERKSSAENLHVHHMCVCCSENFNTFTNNSTLYKKKRTREAARKIYMYIALLSCHEDKWEHRMCTSRKVEEYTVVVGKMPLNGSYYVWLKVNMWMTGRARAWRKRDDTPRKRKQIRVHIDNPIALF